MKAALAIAAAAVLLLGGAAVWRVQVIGTELAQPYDRHATAYVGSTACQSCHQDHHASWKRTFHRTMTQEATPKSVQGRFDGQTVTAWGRSIRPVRRGDEFLFEYLDPQGRKVGEAQIKRTVGSHRYQQYLAQAPDSGENYIRMHLLWHNEEQRWVHLNGAFLHSDAQGFNSHVTTWNHNCIFCHNTGPEPRVQNYEELIQRMGRGERFNFLDAARYDSEVAELGIACEACHGPGAEHAARNRDPLRRYVLHTGDVADPTIVNPRRLDAQRQTYVCAQCHAQRQPARLDLAETWLKTGPTFRPGDDLLAHVRPVTMSEPGPANNPDLYRLRFWADGTPRLSAYEYQGLAQSACYLKGDATCLNCHSAHDGDPVAMMREDGRSNAPCLACHQTLAADVPAHTRHAADSAGSQCVNCHMPKMVYGVMAIHRSHRIETPQPARDAALERPNACTTCHVDQSTPWAEAALASWRGESALAPAPQRAENLRQLFGGDTVQRAVAAERMGQAGAALSSAAAKEMMPLLVHAMEDDYPAVRRFAWKSLRALAAREAVDLGPALDGFDFTGTAEVRAASVQALRARLPAAPLSLDEIAALRAQAAARPPVNIGE